MRLTPTALHCKVKLAFLLVTAKWISVQVGRATGRYTRITNGASMRSLWIPKEMRMAPRLDAGQEAGPVRPNYALLINPFYPKDPHASLGKHVLTPTLALTSIAGATPPEWEVGYWDENLLQGPPPSRPLPH